MCIRDRSAGADAPWQSSQAWGWSAYAGCAPGLNSGGAPSDGAGVQPPAAPWAAGRRVLAAPPSQHQTPSRIPGRGPVGARAQPT
eukprot:10556438-Alexandrium_andersonii.AAC.1